MYPITLPWIVYWSHILVNKGLPRWYASFLLWIPAIGMITWQRAILHMDFRYLKYSEGLLHPLKLMWQSQHNGWILLLGASIGGWFMHRRMSVVLLLVAIANGFIELGMTDIIRSMDAKNWTRTSLWLISVECARWIPLWLLWHKISQRKQRTPYLISTTLFLSLLALWVCGPFISLLIWSQPVSVPTIKVPQSNTSLGMSLPIANPYNGNFDKVLDAQGTTSLPKANWWCRTEAKPNWSTQHRAFAGIELVGDSTFVDLKPHLLEIFQRGITHVGLLTTARDTHWYPPLAKHLRYPSRHWYLTPPPNTARIAKIEPDHSIEWLRQGDDHCALLITWDQTISSAVVSHDELVFDHQCKANIFLVLTDSQEQTEWTPPIPCPH